MNKILPIIALILLCAGAALAQGGKAEPQEIKFARGTTSATLTAVLAGDQQMEYSFTARAGQTAFFRCTTGFDYRLFHPDTGFDTEWTSGADSFELPSDGQYILYVRKKRSPVRRARYTLNITIK
ncbi:MAG: hypothetical protein JSS81_30070 [Acidobacteria bacterium]|nr:hypothetical protein [Acidobacteriota bacterium]